MASSRSVSDEKDGNSIDESNEISVNVEKPEDEQKSDKTAEPEINKPPDQQEV